MKSLVSVVILLSITLFSCVTPDRLNKLTENNLGHKSANYPMQFDDYVFVNTNNLPLQNAMAVSKKVKHLFIPAILFWHWEKNIECVIDPQYAIHLFMEEAMKMAEVKELKKRLDGQKIEISFEEIPNKYLYSHKGHTIILVFAYAVADAEHLFPTNNGFKIKFRLLKGETETSNGEITLGHNLEAMHNTRSSTGKFTDAFLDAYKLDIKRMGKEFTSKLIYKI
jgi:hypothetical protein